MKNTLRDGAVKFWLRGLEGFVSGGLVAVCDGFFNTPQKRPNARAPRLVDRGPTFNLADHLFCGFCVCHCCFAQYLKAPRADEERGL